MRAKQRVRRLGLGLPIFAFVLLFYFPVVSPAQDPPYRYLAVASDELFRMTSGGLQSPEDIDRASNILCTTLTRLKNDRRFRQDLKALQSAEYKYLEDRMELVSEMDLFLGWLHQEKEALLRAGLEERTVEELLWTISTFRNSANEYRVDADRTLSKIEKLRELSCELVGQAREATDREELVGKIKDFILFGIGGAVVIYVDATTTTISLGAAALSGAIGVQMLDKALPE